MLPRGGTQHFFCMLTHAKQFMFYNILFFLENVLTDFEKYEWSAAFLDSCASRKRNNQIQNKLIKKYYIKTGCTQVP